MYRSCSMYRLCVYMCTNLCHRVFTQLQLTNISISIYEGGKVVSPMHRPPLPTPQRISRSQGYSAAVRIKSLKNPSDLIRNGTRDFLACGSMPPPTAPPHTPTDLCGNSKLSEILFFSPMSSTLFKTTTELFQFGLHNQIL
jgi:hypothetical protein